uniref:Complement component 1 Q subcomponent-binding protein, mitochondrial n=1 Tax=Jaculus jaculus TaxID=51337 RepID=A0A8C5KUG2_JACJA
MSGGWELEVNGTESFPPTFDGKERPSQGQKSEGQEPDLISTPSFVVDVIKNDEGKALVLDCYYLEDEIGQEEAESDIFSIKEVSFQATGDSEWKGTNHTLNTDSLDWALYDHLMDFLLVELSTVLEHQEYITFLEALKSLVRSQ